MNADVETALKGASMYEAFNALPPSHKREYMDWINAAKKEATRSGRIAKMITMLGKK